MLDVPPKNIQKRVARGLLQLLRGLVVAQRLVQLLRHARRGIFLHEVVLAGCDAVHLHLHVADDAAAAAIDGGGDGGEALLGQVAALVQHLFACVTHAQAVYQDDAVLHSLTAFDAMRGKLQRVAVVQDEDLLGRHARGLAQLRVRTQVHGLAVHGHECLRLRQ